MKFKFSVAVIVAFCMVQFLFTACNGSEADEINFGEDIAVLDSTLSNRNELAGQIQENSVEKACHYFDSLNVHFTLETRHNFPFDAIANKVNALYLRTHDYDTLHYYITLLFVKKYRYDLECSNLSSELRTFPPSLVLDTIRDPLLYEFLLFSNPVVGRYPIDTLLVKPYEFISSYIVMDFLNGAPKFLAYPEIKKEYDFITNWDPIE